jgi:hypothetical protein
MVGVVGMLRVTCTEGAKEQLSKLPRRTGVFRETYLLDTIHFEIINRDRDDMYA